MTMRKGWYLKKSRSQWNNQNNHNLKNNKTTKKRINTGILGDKESRQSGIELMSR